MITQRHGLIPLILSILSPLFATRAADDYSLGTESTERAPGVPVGRVERFEFTESKVFPSTRRDCWIYVPAQYNGSKPAALMVFQDGHAYVSTNGQMRVPIVFDNLIHRGEMPGTVGLFVNPGHRGDGGPPGDGWGPRNNRSLEYDSLGDAYARFLIEELIPFVKERFKLNFSSDPNLHAICGMSSGGICAWTVAWERPDQFRKVLSHIGSFTNIRGGHVYPALIRKTERKPIRVFLQDGANDLNNLHGNWPLANQEMASALAFAGYDFRFEFGDGAHNGKHGGAILPDSLGWLWRLELAELPTPFTKDNLGGDEALSKVLPDGGKPDDWELVGEGYGFTDAACGDAEGNFFFADLPKGIIYRVGVNDSKAVAWLENGPRISGLKFGPDGQIYACVQGVGTNNVKKIVAIDPQTKQISDVATDVQPNDLIVSKAGWLYFTDTGAGAIVRVPISARGMSRPPPVAGGINKPNGIALSADQRQLVVSEYGGTNVWSFVIAADGSLHAGERYMELRTPVGKPDSGGDGMTTDAQSRCWITSHVGIQMFDATGRLGGVILKPSEKGAVSCAFAGPDRSYLYVCSSDKVYRRKTLTKGATIP
ncbi:MAG: SMP-30/gluconolactonase/LRE family protein [Verrucomicrobia bacterium]|nr:SMP-30/gluconolactonase/LRE family protein [Verrucomicrobiota bacterium]